MIKKFFLRETEFGLVKFILKFVNLAKKIVNWVWFWYLSLILNFLGFILFQICFFNCIWCQKSVEICWSGKFGCCYSACQIWEQKWHLLSLANRITCNWKPSFCHSCQILALTSWIIAPLEMLWASHQCKNSN